MPPLDDGASIHSASRTAMRIAGDAGCVRRGSHGHSGNCVAAGVCVGARVCGKYVLVPRSVGVELDVVAATGI